MTGPAPHPWQPWREMLAAAGDLPDSLDALPALDPSAWTAAQARACFLACTGPLRARLERAGWDPDLAPPVPPPGRVELDGDRHVRVTLPPGAPWPGDLPGAPAGRGHRVPIAPAALGPLRDLVRAHQLDVAADAAAALRAAASRAAPAPAPGGQVTLAARGQVLARPASGTALPRALAAVRGLRWSDAQRGWLAPSSRLPDIARAAELDGWALAPDARAALDERTGPLAFDGTLAGLRAVPVADLAVVGRSRAARFADFGVTTVFDLLMLVPRRYVDRSAPVRIADLRAGEDAAFLATVQQVTADPARRLTRVEVSDGTGRLSVTFFNAPWQARRFRAGDRVLVSGKVEEWVGRTRRALQMANPLMDPCEDGALPVVPVYPQSGKSQVTTWDVHAAVREALARLPELADPLPAADRAALGLPGRDQALRAVHLPDTVADAAAGRDRLAFDELLALQVALLAAKRDLERERGVRHEPTGTLTGALARALPFALTGAQARSWAEVEADLRRPHPMHRLLQGDVGAGKAQPLDALVLAPGGFRRIGELAVGDPVVTPGGDVAAVTGVFPQGTRAVFRVRLDDGTCVRADGQHLWPVRRLGGPLEILTTERIRADLAAGQPCWRLDPIVPVDLGDPGAGRPVPAYDLGRALAARAARQVPRAYRLAPAATRHAVLQGLMDAAGSPAPVPGAGAFPAGPLAGDVAWLARSLGGRASVPGPGGTRIALPGGLAPARDWSPLPAPGPGLGLDRAIVAVDPDGHAEARCIAVGHPSRLYVTDGFAPTHNTLVAAMALAAAVESGHQAALMAPTEILAAQLHAEAQSLLAGARDPSGRPVQVALLTNRLRGRARAELLAGLADGSVHVAVGTHALIGQDVRFASLGLAVVDEQHRFGVEQRAALRGKGPGGARPDLLVMTATPIPRTAAMTVFGDLDVSVLDELPPGRTPIATAWLDQAPDLADRASGPWPGVRAAVAAGHQAYVVCPLVEESERLAAADAVRTRDALAAGALAGLRLGLVHGQQKPAERAAAMDAFRAGDLDVLVATTVIEVGVNVPNATEVVILDCARFGIAQLHQLRGRVGRGSAPGRCTLVGRCVSPDSRARMEALVASTDGFYLSEVDLAVRGHGQVLGAQQSGASDLRVADLDRDRALLEAARDAAAALLRADPALERAAGLRAEIAALPGGDARTWLARS